MLSCLTAFESAKSEAPRRMGDPARLVGDAKKAIAELGWKPSYADLADIVRTAWEWEQLCDTMGRYNGAIQWGDTMGRYNLN